MKNAKSKWRMGNLVLLALGAGLFCTWQNNGLSISSWVYEDSTVPAALHQLRILQISDFHNKRFGKGQTRILQEIRVCKPDLIVITGDLVDRRRYDLGVAMELAEQLPAIAPTYYVAGNHEGWSEKYAEVREALQNAHIRVLDNEKITHAVGDGELQIVGLQDPAFFTAEERRGEVESPWEACLGTPPQGFTVLLSHRPEHLSAYANYGANLVFSGHAHGGQIRLPGIGSLWAPQQGFFPKLAAGKILEKDTTMFVSRGLGNSLFPLRIGNRPELVLVTLETEKA